MTISEQIREAALYARKPWHEMRSPLFATCCDFKLGHQSMMDLPDTGLRTFMLLVAEALE